MCLRPPSGGPCLTCGTKAQTGRRHGPPDGGQSAPAVPYKQLPPGGGQTRPVAYELSARTSVSPKVKSKVRYRLADEQPLHGVAQYQFVDQLSSVLAVGLHRPCVGGTKIG